MEQTTEEKVLIIRECFYCEYRWDQMVTRTELHMLSDLEPIGTCERCGKPT